MVINTGLIVVGIMGKDITDVIKVKNEAHRMSQSHNIIENKHKHNFFTNL